MEGSTQNERKLYGAYWNDVYGGYFSDPEIARPLVDSIVRVVDEREPLVIADIGGGTGFVLSQVEKALGNTERIRFLCVDAAREQLDDCADPLETLQCPMEEIDRSMLARPPECLLLCMRSVLHYFGREALGEHLGRLRAALDEGEFLVHQSICSADARDQQTANLIYELMDTGKWYPCEAELVSIVQAEGFRVTASRRAPSLPLTSAELELRYDVDHERMQDIGRALEEQCGERHTVYVPSENGFTINLDYAVMTCLAQ